MVFRTDDLFLAAFLIASGHSQFDGVAPSGNGRKAIALEPEPTTDIINSFYGGKAELSALAYSEAYKRLLTSMRNTPITV